jgi:hypothetical protein
MIMHGIAPGQNITCHDMRCRCTSTRSFASPILCVGVTAVAWQHDDDDDDDDDAGCCIDAPFACAAAPLSCL